MGELVFNRPLALLPLLSAISILATMVFYLFKAKKSLLLFIFLVSQWTMFLWPLGQAIQYCAAGNRVIMFSIYLIHTSINFVGLMWLIFTIHFTGNRGIIDLKRIAPLAILPLISFLMFLTNPYHHLYFKTIGYDPGIIINVSYGPFFWFGALVTYSYVMAGAVITARYAAGQTGVTKGQAVIITFGPLTPLFISIAYTIYMFAARINIPKFFDLTPSFFSITVIIYSIAVFKYRFLNINPGALKKIFENLPDSILVIDNDNTIVNLNESFLMHFGKYNRNEKTSSLVNQLRITALKSGDLETVLQAIESGMKKPVVRGEINLTEPVAKTFEVIVQKLDNHKKEYPGRIITFHDVTEHKRLLEELNLKNQELSISNRQLSGHLKIVEELAIANERNRVVREIHDTLGHSLTLLIMLMKAAKIEMANNSAGSKEKLSEGIKIAQAELNELRWSISGLLSKDMIDMDIIESVQNLVQYMKTLDINIEFSVFGKEIYTKMPASIYKLKLSDAIYKICKEAITNSLRHGNASAMNIIMKFNTAKAHLFIFDNGRGCPKVVPGFGLTGMADRVKDLRGTIKFGSDGETGCGFNIQVELPMEGYGVD